MTETKTLKQRIEEDGLTAELEATSARPPWHPEWECYGYAVTLRMGERTMQTNFWTGRGWEHPPEVHDVLGCLISDSAGYINSPTVRDWVDEYGYEDEEQAEAIFEAVRIQCERLGELLGNKLDAYLWHTTEDDS